MNSKLTKFALTAAIALALPLLACEEPTTLTDTRDKKNYKTVKIGEQVWMAENLNFEAKGSKCGGTDIIDEGEDILYSIVEENTVNCDKYGRLYNWETAVKACPSGWKLPSKAEWDVLITTVGGEKTAGKYLKAKSGWNDNGNGEDKFGFAALPGGYGSSSNNFRTVGDLGNWWSATESNGNYAIYLFNGGDGVRIDYDNRDSYSVRCIQN